MRALLLLPLLLAAPSSAQAPDFAGAFALPYVLCDCDPADFVFRTTRALPGYAAPDPAGPVVRTVATGRLIEGNDWDEALTVTVTPGVAVARRALALPGWQRLGAVRSPPDMDGLPEVTLSLAAGDRVEYLLGEEGHAFLRHDGVVYAGVWPFGGEDFRWERAEPAYAVWLRLTPKPGRPAAWVRVEMDAGRGRNVEVLCETHGGCVPGFRR